MSPEINPLISKPISSESFSYTDLGIVSVDNGINAESDLLNNHKHGNVDVLIYTRNEPVVSVGKFSDLSDVRNKNVKTVRRISGGSSIFSDENQIVYAIVFDTDLIKTKELAYSVACGFIVNVLNSLGIEAEYKQPNDVTVNGYKISGSAQYRDDEKTMVHGSLILDNEESIPDYIEMKTGQYPGVISIKTINEKLKRENVSEAFLDVYLRTFSS